MDEPRAPQGKPTPFQHLDPDAVAERYGFPANQGSGVTLGIFGWGGLGEVGVDTACVTKRLNEKHPGNPQPNYQVRCIGQQTNNGAISGELFMDSMITGWYVPAAAAINVYLAEEADVPQAIRQAVEDGCSVTTASFGIHAAQNVEPVNDALAYAAANGLTTCFASGDLGAASGQFVDAVVFPAASPYALAVGGTFIPSESGVESVWWNYSGQTPGSRPSPWWASGGGVSKLFGVPGYQAAIDPESFPVHHQTYHGRGVPDVAALAEGNDGWVGTSAATPTVAALITRINAALDRRVGDIHDVIYAPPSPCVPFTSITQGNNIPPPGLNLPELGYTAQTGWDACTGLGVPDGEQLLKALEKAGR